MTIAKHSYINQRRSKGKVCDIALSRRQYLLHILLMVIAYRQTEHISSCREDKQSTVYEATRMLEREIQLRLVYSGCSCEIHGVDFTIDHVLVRIKMIGQLSLPVRN